MKKIGPAFDDYEEKDKVDATASEYFNITPEGMRYRNQVICDLINHAHATDKAFYASRFLQKR